MVALPVASSVMSGYDWVVANSTSPVGAVLLTAATFTVQSRLKMRHWNTPFGGPVTVNVTSAWYPRCWSNVRLPPTVAGATGADVAVQCATIGNDVALLST